jgi:UDP-N-acetylglucosamine--N-acetylmuramyl-(pentapeptide) pyrophosphoryl-undecaprenol N-acetylglucosamine transferase
MKTIALTGGGTAGHVMPNIALIPELKKHFDKIIYIGGNGIETEIAPKFGLEFFKTDVIKFSRAKPLSNLKIPLILSKAKKEAKEILIKNHVKAVFSKGGYASLPACLAAKSLGIPVVTHESDFSLGLANKVIAKFAAATLTSFPETEGGVCVGNPVREELFLGSAPRAKAKYSLSNKPVLLVFGGSLGAKSVNEAVYKAAEELTKTYDVIHIAGKTGEPLKLKGYTQLEYAYDMNDLYAAASVLVIRGGANSLCEAATLGKHSVCIPLPKGNSRGDQVQNALSFEKRGLTQVLFQQDLSPKTLIDAVNTAYKKPKLAPVQNIANKKIVDEILKTLN